MVEILIKAMSSVSEALIRHSAILKASQGCGYKSANEQHSEQNQVTANYSFYPFIIIMHIIIVSVFFYFAGCKGMMLVCILFQVHCLH